MIVTLCCTGLADPVQQPETIIEIRLDRGAGSALKPRAATLLDRREREAKCHRLCNGAGGRGEIRVLSPDASAERITPRY